MRLRPEKILPAAQQFGTIAFGAVGHFWDNLIKHYESFVIFDGEGLPVK
jgi:hypothetical protein